MNQTQPLMTLMFADVAVSARIYERLGDLEASHAVDRCMKRITRCIEAAQGRTVQITGDELLAVFESFDDAFLAAIDMQARIVDLPPVSGLQLTIRVGLHTGMVSEAANTLSGLAVVSAARITGLAAREQILVSESLVNCLTSPQAGSISLQAALGQISEGESRFSIYELAWHKPHVPVPVAAVQSHKPRTLHITYHDKSFKLDAQSQALTLGRDPDSQLLIEDRKASRKHARIEYRPEGFFYIDRSTNGSFLSFCGQHEILLRQDEIKLLSDGQICFGTSRNDPNSDSITFELRESS